MSRTEDKFLNDPNVVSSEQEEADIAKGRKTYLIRILKLIPLAIALSLSDQSKYTPPPVVKEEPKKK